MVNDKNGPGFKTRASINSVSINSVSINSASINSVSINSVSINSASINSASITVLLQFFQNKINTNKFLKYKCFPISVISLM